MSPVVRRITKSARVAAVNPALVRERLFFAALGRFNVEAPVPEYRFHPTRKWRLDYAWPSFKLGLEVEGGVWTRGKHGRGSGIVKDMEKSNALACMGWRLLRVTPSQLATMETAHMVRSAILGFAP